MWMKSLCFVFVFVCFCYMSNGYVPVCVFVLHVCWVCTCLCFCLLVLYVLCLCLMRACVHWSCEAVCVICAIVVWPCVCLCSKCVGYTRQHMFVFLFAFVICALVMRACVQLWGRRCGVAEPAAWEKGHYAKCPFSYPPLYPPLSLLDYLQFKLKQIAHRSFITQ